MSVMTGIWNVSLKSGIVFLENISDTNRTRIMFDGIKNNNKDISAKL
jgi:hypothetical protein